MTAPIYTDLTDLEFIAHCECFQKQNGETNFTQAFEALGKRADDKTALARYWKAKYQQSEQGVLENENRALKAKVKIYRQAKEQDRNIQSYIESIMKISFNAPIDMKPKWTESSIGINKIVPALVMTDVHLGETVNSEEVGIQNDYSTDIAIKRVNQCVDDFIDICFDKFTKYHYDGCVLPLVGDNLTGSIHDLAETNDRTAIEQVQELTELIAQQVVKMQTKFKKVFVPAVTGNHSRMSHYRTKVKGRVNDSLESLVHANLQYRFKNDKNVSIHTNQSDYVTYDINGRRFRQEHGDSYRGGNGIGGIFIPIKRGIAKKTQVAVATNQEFDTMLMGHWHTHHIESSLIIGNSTKGYDEFAKSLGLPYSSPGMTCFFVNKRGDIVFPTDIKCRDSVSKPVKEGITVW